MKQEVAKQTIIVHAMIVYNDEKNGGFPMARLHMRIVELLTEKDISKNQICKDLDLPRGNFNRYCRDEFQRIDANLVLKLCDYFECDINDLIVIEK